ncbi:MAG: Xaa-Pro peptidase family protein [Vicinamibacterales bacterium]
MHADRRARAQGHLHSLDLDALIVGHPPNIRYLTGLNASAGLLVLGVRACVLIVDFRYATTARALADATEGLSVVVGEGALDAAVPPVLGRLGAGRVGVEGEHLTLGRFNRLSSALTVSELQPLASDERAPALVTTERVVERMRAVKDGAEIETMREAGRRISAVARKARTWVRPGLTEQAIAAAVDAAMREAGFERPAFETIVASGENGALPHARPTGRVVQDRDGVLLDFGGVYDGYCVDLSRTLHIGPMPAPFRRLFEAVREAQAAAIGEVRAGALPAAIDAAARRVLERHGLGEAFGHGTGHGLGLEVHEEPRLSRLAPGAEPVQAGMIVTIEPGAYVAGIGGVRIEDDVLVTAEGCERLTDVPIEL